MQIMWKSTNDEKASYSQEITCGGMSPAQKMIHPNTLVVHMDRATQQLMFIVTSQKTIGVNCLKYRIISLQIQENF